MTEGFGFDTTEAELEEDDETEFNRAGAKEESGTTTGNALDGTDVISDAPGGANFCSESSFQY